MGIAIDVELGARLFDHLLALPMAYFANRRVGDSVARVRELENIRNFITGSALTLTIDLLFTFVFFAVMFLYSVTLTWIVIVLEVVKQRHLQLFGLARHDDAPSDMPVIEAWRRRRAAEVKR